MSELYSGHKALDQRRPAYFNTLNEALASEGLLDMWPLGLNIAYGETIQTIQDNMLISVYRNGAGRYERPIHYSTN